MKTINNKIKISVLAFACLSSNIFAAALLRAKKTPNFRPYHRAFGGISSIFSTQNFTKHWQPPSIELINSARQKILECPPPYFDPSLDPTWAACQVTATYNMLIWNRFNSALTGCFSDGLLASSLLQESTTEPQPLTPFQFKENMRSLGLLSDAWPLVDPTSGQCNRWLRATQSLLKQEIAHTLQLELQPIDDHNFVIKNRMKAMENVVDLLKEAKTDIGIAVYEGAPTLDEVKSFTGLQHFFVFGWNEDKKNWILKTEKSDFSLTINGGVSITRTASGSINFTVSKEGERNPSWLGLGKTRTSLPQEDKSYFVIHTAYQPQLYPRFVDETQVGLGNIVSKLDIPNIDIGSFMLDNFRLFSHHPDEIDLNDLPSRLSVFHYNFIPRFNLSFFAKKGLSRPPAFQLASENIRAEFSNQFNHPLVIYHNDKEPIDTHPSPDYATTILKGHRGKQYLMRIYLTSDQREFDDKRSYFRVLDEKIGHIKSLEEIVKHYGKFMQFIDIHIKNSFCPQTRIMLKECLITKKTFDKLSHGSLKEALISNGINY